MNDIIKKQLIKQFLPMLNEYIPQLDGILTDFKNKNLKPMLKDDESDVGFLIGEEKGIIYVILPVFGENGGIVRVLEFPGYGKKMKLTEFIGMILNLNKKNGN
jgi:hypothetical protein